jgi:hypothetical protein
MIVPTTHAIGPENNRPLLERIPSVGLTASLRALSQPARASQPRAVLRPSPDLLRSPPGRAVPAGVVPVQGAQASDTRLRRPASAGLTGSRTAELSDSETIDSIDGCCSSVPIV